MDRRIGVVVIGRNEGQRLRRCLESIRSQTEKIIYVDSGSTDGSIELARSLGADVVELDMAHPFTGARARNAGFERLQLNGNPPEFVQFIDGDCELQKNWLHDAGDVLTSRPDLAAVTGRLRERFPERSIYNRLCDMEWRQPPGETNFFPGIVMIRTEAFIQAGGYNPAMIAGEEPELALRITRHGWKILRLENEMALHDANILRFGQWWKRMVRSGHAYAESAAMHGRERERYCVRQTARAIIFGLAMPCFFVCLIAIGFYTPWIAAFAIFPLLLWARAIFRSYKYRRNLGDRKLNAALYAMMAIPTNVAEAIGVLRYGGNRLRGRKTRLIEYKIAGPATTTV